jgi:hypothetical protein
MFLLAAADSQRSSNGPAHGFRDNVPMNPLLAALLTASLAGGGHVPDGACSSYLYEPAYHLDYKLRGHPRPYLPQPGDIMMYTDKNLFWEITHDLALAFQPHGSGIVVCRPDGTLGTLEAGPNDTYFVRVLDTLPHLREYEVNGPVWIRKRRTPLTAEQSACLTAFAMRQEWKKFALIRLGGQLTPLRSRGPLRTFILGKPRGDRDGYFCSELVTEACVAAGLVDRRTARPSCTYPHDLFYDWSFNLYLTTHFTLAHGWEPPARWVSSPCSPARP